MARLLLTASLLVLAACGGAPPSAEDVCNKMVEGDPEAAEQIGRDGIKVADLCACVGATVDAKPENEREPILAVMYAVSNIRQADGVGVEQAAEKLEEQLRNSTGGHVFSESAFENVGRLLDDIGDQLQDGGSCQAG